MENSSVAVVIILIIILVALTSNSSNVSEAYQGGGSYNDYGSSQSYVVPAPVRSYYRPNMVDGKPFTHHQGIDAPYPLSAPKIVIGYHYTAWCPYCIQMSPVWGAVKKNIESQFFNIVMKENNEGKKATPGINSYPTILKYVNGRAYKYTGPAEYDQLRTWILNPVHENLIYGFL